MKKFSVLAAAAAFVGNLTQARTLQGIEGDTPKCCTLFSGNPNEKRTKTEICEKLQNAYTGRYVNIILTEEDLA